MAPKLAVPTEKLGSFCRQYQVKELSLFGSVLGDSFRPDSDVDVLVSFLPEANPTLVDMGEMRTALEALFNRKVDLVEAEAIQNPFRRYSILKNREKVYAA